MDELTKRLSALHTAVVSDALDAVGVEDRVMNPGVVALGRMRRAAGRAATLSVSRVDEIPAEPYRVQFAAIDVLRPGEILVVAAADAASAFWGELITTRALARGGVGVVVDGYCRDIAQVRRQEFGVWARGTHPADSLGRMDGTAFGGPITCAGARVSPGDYVIADEDGVVVVPAELATEVVERAAAKAAIEDEVRSALAAGESIADTYARYRVM